MRTIKFKGKSVDSGEWIYGDLNHLVDGVYISNDNGSNMAQVDPYTICHFTGFQDMEGNDIYEGDILASDCIYPLYLLSIRSRDESNPNYVGVVIWNEHVGSFELKMHKNGIIQGYDCYVGKSCSFNKTFATEYEVIGSIHDSKWQEKLNLKTE